MYSNTSSKSLAARATAVVQWQMIINKQANNVSVHHTFSGSRQPGDRFHDAVENVSSRKLPVMKITQHGRNKHTMIKNYNLSEITWHFFPEFYEIIQCCTSN